tara:strand:+ start:835 stop:1032 length:198 start_codon:yes stop_codon:yes gene_type:complete
MRHFKIKFGRNLRHTIYAKTKNQIGVLNILRRNKFPTKYLDDLKIKEIDINSWEYYDDKIKLYYK